MNRNFAVVRSQALIASVLATSCLFAPKAFSEELTGDMAQLGSTTFGSGSLPPAGVTGLATRMIISDINKVADSNGHMQAPLKSVDATMYAVSGILTHMTNLKFLGADYGVQVIFPYVNSSANTVIAAGPKTIEGNGHFSNLVNVTVSPIMLQWRDPTRTFNQNFMLDVTLPIGAYEGSNPLNAGTDAYAVRPKYTFTYLSRTGFEVTASASVEYSFKDRHENYQTGVIGAFNFAVGQHIGSFVAGLSGYALKQFNGDTLNGAPVGGDGHKARVFALGPVISYRDVNDPRSLFVSVKYLREFGAQNRTQGNAFWLLLAHPI